MNDWLDGLRSVVGAAHVLTDGDLTGYELDWRKRYRGHALAVVCPADTAQVAEIVRRCAAAGVTIVPQGGNTGLVGGGVPDASGRQLLLSLRRMNHIRRIDRANLTLTLDAGCVLQAAQQAAEACQLLLPLSLAAEGSCTIGGNLATNAGGTQVLRYGNARELCLGLEVVTAQGEVWDGLSGLRKDNTGYALRDLYIGSEGTLGVITAATMKLHPLPAARITALAGCASLDDAMDLLDIARRELDAGLTAFELMSDVALALVARHLPLAPPPWPALRWTVLLECSSGSGPGATAAAQHALETVLEAALAQGVIADAVVADSLARSRALWHLREAIPLAQAEEGLNIKHDIALPVSAIPAFVAATDAELLTRWPGVRLVNFGHLGDGNLHYNVQAPVGVPAADFLARHEAAVNQLVYDAVQGFGGSISAEHGIGALKRDELALRKSPVALGLMRAVKNALDPQGLMNPGRLL